MKKRVLLIDDDETIHNYMKQAFKILENALDFNLEFNYCKSIDDAYDALKHEVYDLVLLDYFIRQNTSENFLMYIKEKYPDTKINIITSIRDYAILKRLLKSGASRIIYKPLSWHNIIGNIRENLFATNIKKEIFNENIFEKI